MANKVKVYGQSQKWTALGIVAAYVKMHPHATLKELQKAFPTSELNNTLDTVENILKADKSGSFDEKMSKQIGEMEMFITLEDGSQVAFTNPMWPADKFQKIVEVAKKHDIEIAEYKDAEKGIGKRGSYSLEYLNGYVPPKTEAPKKTKSWLWILLVALAIIGLLLALLARSFNKEPEVITKEVEKVITKEVEKTVIVRDTVFVQEIEEIEKNYNAAQFKAGKADLPEAAKFVLHDLAKVMEKHPEIKLRLEGHTSAEGTESFNQKLSEQRAQAAVNFLVNHEKIDASRLEAVGLGSSKLKNTDDPKAPENRRTEFVIIEE